MTHYLQLEDLFTFIRALKIGPVRDAGLLDSSLARPRSTVFGSDAYPTLQLKAAALLHSLVKNHSLVDGNKRLAWLATVVFLDINAHAVNLTDDEAFDLVWEIAGSTMTVDTIAQRLKVVSKAT